MSYTEPQIAWLSACERWAAGLSFLFSSTAILLFCLSKKVKSKWVNRLVLYALIENLAYTITGFIALDGLSMGAESDLCRFQAFMIEATLPPDALWSFTLALILILIVFRGYRVEQLKKLEPIFIGVNCGLPLVTASILLAINTADRGPVYGSANFWCWISAGWQYLRIVVSYGISWFCIVSSLLMYLLAGWRWDRVRRAANKGPDDILTYFWTSLWVFVFALITWVPSSVNRVRSIIYPDAPVPFGLALTAAMVVQFAGFYNGVIFLTRNRKDCQLLLEENLWPKLRRLRIYQGLRRITHRSESSMRAMTDDVELG